MYGVIYKIQNTIDNKVYIGQTKRNPEVRFNEYKRYCHNHLLKEAFEKFGFDSFTFDVIDTAEDYSELDYKERYWIEQYNSTDKEFGYNLCKGGQGPLGTAWSYESRKNASKDRKGSKWFHNDKGEHTLVRPDKQYLYKDWIPGYGAGRIRGHQTEETKKKIRESNKGKHNRTQEMIDKQVKSYLKRKFHWYTNGIENIQVPESDTVPEGFHRGKTVSQEFRDKISFINKGRTAWNKGLTKDTDERVRKYSKSIKRIEIHSNTEKTH